jgi:hypothetical protein
MVDLLGDDGCYFAGVENTGVENDAECTNMGGTWQIYTPSANQAGVTGDVTNTPTAEDYLDFFVLWASGAGPSTINYGPNDGATQDIARTSTVQQARERYIAANCPASQRMQTDHVGPFVDGYVGGLGGDPNYTEMQVGGFNGTISTIGSTTTFTVTNTAGQASFSGATTIGRAPATALPYGVGLISPKAGMAVSLLSAAGTRDNPYGPAGPFHNITQTFQWTEKNLCK